MREHARRILMLDYYRIKIIFLFFLCVIVRPAISGDMPWQDQCPGAPGCEHVGKIAYNADHLFPSERARKVMSEIPLGPIIGVAWRPEGSLLYIEPAVEPAGIPQQAHLSPRDAWYYIIGPGGVRADRPFLREQREIQIK